YNVAPTSQVPILRVNQGQREPVAARWGLIPPWAKDEKISYSTINAKAETVHEKPAFRAAFKRKRCVVLADGYYEWTGPKGDKQPHYIRMADDRPLVFLGLWENWRDNISCTIITTEANPQLEHLHSRMPCITAVDSDSIDLWLDPEFEDSSYLRSLLKPVGDGVLQSTKVSRYVNKVGNQGPECIEPLAAE
ncbi:MAG: SOS response-associated peptidase, partial [Bythopirellula sp.]